MLINGSQSLVNEVFFASSKGRSIVWYKPEIKTSISINNPDIQTQYMLHKDRNAFPSTYAPKNAAKTPTPAMIHPTKPICPFFHPTADASAESLQQIFDSSCGLATEIETHVAASRCVWAPLTMIFVSDTSKFSSMSCLVKETLDSPAAQRQRRATPSAYLPESHVRMARSGPTGPASRDFESPRCHQ
jgi:hypothetical protein